ncbi:MAG: SGNH/GDSL hydrolase family protein [Francisellaceae bacterium]
MTKSIHNTLKLVIATIVATPVAGFATAGADVIIGNNCPYTVEFIQGDNSLQRLDKNLTLDSGTARALGYLKDASKGIGFKHHGQIKGSLIFWLHDDWQANYMDSREVKGNIAIDQISKSWHSWEGTPTFTITACPSDINLENSAIMKNINRVLVFGDSLSDKGTLFEYTQGIIPKSPPYYNGMFSNGNVWAKLFKNDLQKHNIELSNYAVGGATAYFHVGEYLPYSLNGERQAFETNATLKNWKNYNQFLAIIWIGANDYLSTNKDMPQQDQINLVNQVIDSINNNMAKLIDKGIDTFVLIELPNLGLTPSTIYDNGNSIVTEQLSKLHNMKLKSLIDSYKMLYPDKTFKLINIDTLFETLIKNTSTINKQYNLEITNTKDSCWNGGYTSQANSNYQNEVYNMAIPRTADINAAIKVAESGVKCQNPENYVFWDRVHPTSEVQAVLYQYIKQQLDIKTTTPATASL